MNGKNERHYKPDKKLYILLLTGSAIFIAASFLIAENNRWFTIIIGLGCSGIASVIVAWLLDQADCVHKETSNNYILDNLFGHFDSTVQYELNCLLEICAKQNSEIDVDKEYTIQELYNFVTNANGNLPVWDKPYHNFGVAFYSIDASLLLSYDPIPQHIQLYNNILSSQGNHNQYQYISGNYEVEKGQHGSLAYLLMCGDIYSIDSVFSLRNKKVICTISDDSKEQIRALRINS